MLNLPDKVSGIYIWGFYGDKDFLPYYVGHAEDIKKRIAEHIVLILGGSHKIFRKEHLRNFKEHKDNKDGQLIHILDKPENIIAFIEKRDNDYKPHIDEMIDNFYFTYAEADKEYHSDLEKSIIEVIGKVNLGNYRGGKPKAYEHINGGDETVCKILE